MFEPPLLLLEQAGEVAGEVADLLLLEDQALDVLRLAGEVAVGDVDDRELRVGKLLRDLRDRVGLVEADGDDEVGVLARRGREVRDVRLGRGGLVDGAVDAEIPLRLQQALVGELVEAVVVQLVDVGDEDDERLPARGRRACCCRCRSSRRSRPRGRGLRVLRVLQMRVFSCAQVYGSGGTSRRPVNV